MKRFRWTPNRILATGFAVMALLGGLLLSLPAASRCGEGMAPLDALFTATSASCVTGLAVYDTWTRFSPFGQAVILLLIQLGGLGFIMAMVSVLFLTKRHIGLRQRALLAESIGTDRLAGIIKLARRILIGTALFEGGGAVILATRFVPIFGWARGLWFALFHSVSAFCNAGFDLMGVLSPSSSFTAFSGDPAVVLTLAVLILAGGIGFIVWADLLDSRREHRRLRLHSRLALVMTGALTLLGTAALLALEWDGALGGMSVGEKLLNAIFHAVTPRTAGFNTVELGSLGSAGKGVTILLMLIGAAPGGTGGGVKVSTFAVVLAAVYAAIRQRDDVSLGRYRVESHTVSRAFAVFVIFIGMATVGTLVLCTQGVDLANAIFECVSAVATVGLAADLTQPLTAASKMTIILLMYAGRVGGLTLFFAMNRRAGAVRLKNAVGKVYVG